MGKAIRMSLSNMSEPRRAIHSSPEQLKIPDYSHCVNLLDAIELLEKLNGVFSFYDVKHLLNVGHNTWKGILSGTVRLQNKTLQKLQAVFHIPLSIANRKPESKIDINSDRGEWIERAKQNSYARKIAHELGLKDV